jgi:signal transduction histidine kinase
MSGDRVTDFLRTPKFGDEESEWIARSVTIISSATALLGAGLFVAAPWLTSEPLPSMVVYTVITLFSLAGLWLLRRGQLERATTLFSVNTWLVTTAALVLFGGISGPVASSYVLAVVVISSVSGWRAGLGATLACILASGVMAYLDHRHLFPAPVSPLSPLTAWATVASTVALAAVTIHLTSRTMMAALKRARDNERMLADHSDNLESVVAERTRELEVAKDAAEDAARAVRIREARFHALFSQAKVAIWDCDLAGLGAALRQMSSDALERASISELRELFASIAVIDVNGETLKRFGAPDTGTFIDGLPTLLVEQSRPMLQRLFTGLRNEERALEEQGVLQTFDGEQLHVIVGISTAFGEKDDELQTIVTVSDVTPLHRAREAAHELAALRADELERIDKEVERLFYAVSHDLRSPLRGVANLAEWAQEDLREGQHDAVAEHLERLAHRVLRLETMLNDLLSFARVGRTEHVAESVDVNLLLGEIGDALLTVPDGFEVHWNEMPVLNTQKTLLMQVFMNLIGNAIKHHDKPRGRIEVSHRVADDEHEFVVADDGPGIPEKHREKVFEMFSTLQPRDDVEGSGMGLAFAHKLVTLRGGRLSIEDGPDGGAAFRFTWREARPRSTAPPAPLR